MNRTTETLWTQFSDITIAIAIAIAQWDRSINGNSDLTCKVCKFGRVPDTKQCYSDNIPVYSRVLLPIPPQSSVCIFSDFKKTTRC